MSDRESITPLSKINGLILAGGKSIRMGSDKGLINYHGKPQREFLFDLLKTVCAEVFTSCKPMDQMPHHLNPLPDQLDIESPLNGVISAFRLNSAIAWLTAPVDMPFINQEALTYLITHRDATKIATCYYDSEGRDPEPLLTLWEPHAYPLLNEHYQSGHKGIKPFLLTHDIQLLQAPDGRIHQNINSPEQLVAYQKILHGNSQS